MFIPIAWYNLVHIMLRSIKQLLGAKWKTLINRNIKSCILGF